jgi:hypothetical protein
MLVKIGKVCPLEYIEIPRVNFMPHHSADISRTMKAITNAKMDSKATLVFKIIVAMMWSNIIVATL